MANPSPTSGNILQAVFMLALVGAVGILLNAIANTAVDKLKAAGIPLP